MDNLDKFQQYVDALALKLEKPAAFVHDLLLRQVYFEGAIAAFWVLLSVVVFIMSIRTAKHMWELSFKHDAPIILPNILGFVGGPKTDCQAMGGVVVRAYGKDITLSLQVPLGMDWDYGEDDALANVRERISHGRASCA